MQKISEFGCIVCYNLGVENRRPACVHHILKNGRRQGHLETIPLCEPHHKSGEHGQTPRHPFKAEFERKYGTENELLTQLRTIMAITSTRPAVAATR